MQEESNTTTKVALVHQGHAGGGAQAHLTELQPKQLNILVVALSITCPCLLLLNIINIIWLFVHIWANPKRLKSDQ